MRRRRAAAAEGDVVAAEQQEQQQQREPQKGFARSLGLCSLGCLVRLEAALPAEPGSDITHWRFPKTQQIGVQPC